MPSSSYACFEKNGFLLVYGIASEQFLLLHSNSYCPRSLNSIILTHNCVTPFSVTPLPELCFSYVHAVTRDCGNFSSVLEGSALKQ